MNRSYRQVWSAARGAYIIAPETARGAGKAGRSVRAVRAAAMLAVAAAFAQGAAAQSAPSAGAAPATVVPTGGKTNAYVSANGVPVVNINTANAAGLSHNQFTRYDVDSKGLVLNNSSFATAAAMQSQLAGQVVGNVNLAEQARVILNEVVSTNRSTLAGYTEVLGGKADVIVANPYGITCSGCGFINSDRVTLTTGVPFFNADGAIGGFDVRRGDVLVNGAGLNASAQQILDIVARTVRLDGQVNVAATGELGIYAGALQWGYADRAVTGAAQADGAAPSYAIDSSALGGMYAGRIRLIATEAGVGVRMLGDAAASGADFRLDAAGKVELQGRVSATKDIAIAQSGTQGAAQLEIKGAGASLTAQDSVMLKADGGIALSEGSIKAGANLVLRGASLDDASMAAATRNAGGNVDVAVAGNAAIGGTAWGAGGSMTLHAGGDIAASGTTLYGGGSASAVDRSLAIAAGGDALFTKTKLTGTDAVALSAGGHLGADAGTEATAATNLLLSADTGFDNAGKLLAGQDLSLKGNAGSTATNAGLLQAQHALAIGGSNALAFSNAAAGKLLGDSVAIAATTFDNAGVVQGTNGVDLAASGAFANAKDALVLSTAAGKGVKLATASLGNAGRIQSAGALGATVAGDVVNSGELVTTAQAEGGADGALAIDARNIDNDGLAVAAGGTTLRVVESLVNRRQVQGATLLVEAGKMIVNQGPDGVLLAKGDAAFSAASLTNSGTVQAGAGLAAKVATVLANSGVLQTRDKGGSLSLEAASIENAAAGVVGAAGNAALRATRGNLANAGQLSAGGALELDAAGTVDNDGTAVAGGTLRARGARIDNAGTAQGGSLLDVATTGVLANSGILQAIDAGARVALHGASIDTLGTVQSAGSAALQATTGGVVNRGRVLAGGDLSVSARTSLNNVGADALLAAKADVSLRAATLRNDGTIQAVDGLRAQVADRLDNAGALQATGEDSALSVEAGNMLNTGVIRTSGTADMTTTGDVIDNRGEISAVDGMTLAAATTLVNRGSLLSRANLAAQAVDFDNRGTVQGQRNVAITATGDMANSNLILTREAGGTLALFGGAIDTTGTVQAAGAARLAADGAVTNGGKITAAGNIAILAATGFDNTGTGSQVIGSQDVTIGGGNGFTMDNAGRVQAAGDLAIGSASRRAASLGNTGTLFGTDVAIHGGSIVNEGRVQALGNGTIDAASLANQGSTAVMIFGIEGGDAAITLSGALRNSGALHSGGNLSIRASLVQNTGTAGISSLADTTITAASGGISNAGALYAADKLTTTATGQVITNTDSGTMDATDIAISAGTFNNYNSVIATNDTVIATTVAFNNLPTGRVPDIVVASTDYGAVTVPHDSGEYNCNIFGDYCDQLRVYAQSYKVTQGLDAPMPTQKGEIIAGNKITIHYGLSGRNQASLISAPTIDISGTGTFTNEDLHLEEISYVRRWRDYKTDSTFGSLNHDWTFPTTTDQFGCNDGGCFTGHAGSGTEAANNSAALETGRRVIQVWRAGIYATDLNFNGGALMNLGSPYQQAANATTQTGTGAATATQTSGSNVTSVSSGLFSLLPGVKVKPQADNRSVKVETANAVSFAGLNLTLPTNPNGYFVPVKDPNANYLVETNPLFQVGSNSVGSDYLSKLLGIDAEKQQKRLGDSNYEAKLVRDQLIAQTGNNIIKGMANEAAQIQALMDNAASQAAGLGLAFGQPLSKEQAAALTEDMVWMVEQVVNGQKVLAPVVYLAQSTRDAIEKGGPVISATNANIKAGTLTNTGGTIAGDKLAIETEGDLRNTGGKIKGGDVSVKSTNGSIINETVAQTQGGKDFARTVIGAAGSIESTGNLSLDAARDITVKGASVKAGGDASLAAGGAVTFDTIQDKSADTTYKATEGLWGLSGSSEKTHTATTTNIGSTLETGGNLKVKSGGDTTIAGSSVKVGGDLAMDAGGDVNIIARQDTVETSNSSSKKGLGVGGGLYGATETTTDTFKGRNVASSIEVGGNATVNTDGTLTLQGSKLKVGGDAELNAADVQVLAGKDEDRTTTTTTTTSFLKLASASGSADSGAGAQAGAGSSASSSNRKGNAQAGAQAGAAASAGAEASASGSAGLTLAETTTTNTMDYKSRAVGSEIDIGGNLKVDSKKDVVLQGASVNVGGDAELKAARDVKILASQDIDISTSKTSTTQIGLYVDSENKASASAEASASASASASSGRNGSAAGANAQAGARAGAEASSDTNIDLVRTQTTETNSLDIRNNGTTLNTGGKLKIDAGNKLTVQGSDVAGEGGVALKAKDMEFLAAEDVSVTSTKTTKTSAGLYVSGSASAEAGASASASASASQNAGGQNAGANFNAQAGASAEAKVGAGIQARHSTESSTEGSTTARVSTIRSGSGDIERTASGKITDVGTEIEAAGDFSQSAGTIESRAARNTTFSSSESQSDSMKLGVYAKAGAEAKAEASGSADAGAGLLGPGMGSGTKSGADAGADVSAGVEAQYAHSSSSSSSNSSEAVVSTIKAGGKVSSKSTGKTTLEGTQIAGGGDVALEAKEVDFKAARNTESSSESNLDVNASASVGLNLGSSGAVDGALGGGFEKGNGSASSSTAVTGSIQSGGNLTIKTQGDARFEGTDIGAAGDASVAAGGKLTFDAARNESSESSNSSNAQVDLSISKSRGGDKESSAGLEASGGFANDKSTSSEAVTGRIAAGGNLTLSAGKDMKFEGTNVEAGGDTDIAAGGNVDFAAARNTSSSTSTSVSASLNLSASSSSDSAAGTSEKSRSGAFGAEGGHSTEKSSEAVAGSLSTGGNLKVKSGGNAAFEGTDIAAGGKAAIDARGDVSFKAAESTSESFGVSASIGAEATSTTKTGGTPAAGAAAAGPETERERGGSVGFELGKSSSSDKKAATIGAGSIDITSGRNANFEGTKVAADGDINVAAKGDVNVTTAKSTSSNVGVSLNGGHESSGNPADADSKRSSTRVAAGFEVGSSSTNDGASFASGGKVAIGAGGRANLVSAEVKADGGQQVNAAGGVTRGVAADTGSGFGMSAVARSDTKPKEVATPAAAPSAAAVPPVATAKGDAAKAEPAQAVPAAVVEKKAPAKKAAVKKTVATAMDDATKS